jgi:hypothetical protein
MYEYLAPDSRKSYRDLNSSPGQRVIFCCLLSWLVSLAAIYLSRLISFGRDWVQVNHD